MNVSQILSVEFPTADHRYNGDSMRRAAYLCAMQAGETGVCLVLVKRQGYDPIQTVVNVAAKEASIVLPVPADVKKIDFGTAFFFPDEICLVTEQSPEFILPRISEAFPHSYVTIVALDRENACITAAAYGMDRELPIVIKRSTEAAAAAAMALHLDLENGTMESTIGQPGGILEIGMRKENGNVTGLSAGGPVDLELK